MKTEYRIRMTMPEGWRPGKCYDPYNAFESCPFGKTGCWVQNEKHCPLYEQFNQTPLEDIWLAAFTPVKEKHPAVDEAELIAAFHNEVTKGITENTPEGLMRTADRLMEKKP